MLEDNWALHGPHHLLLPGPTSFKSMPEEAPWLEIELDEETFLSGLLVLGPDDASPLQATLLAEDHPRSGTTEPQPLKVNLGHCFQGSLREELLVSLMEEEDRQSYSLSAYLAQESG